MEDILASIRKIISEDEPVALESPEDAPIVNVAEAQPAAIQTPSALDSVLTEFGRAPEPLVTETAKSESLDVESFVDDSGSVDLDIDSILASLDDDLMSDAEAEQVEAPVSDVPPSKMHVEPEVDFGADDDEDILAFLDQGIELEDDASGDLGSDLSDDLSATLNGVEDFVLPSSEIAPEIVSTPEPENLVRADALVPEPSNSDDEIDDLLEEILMTGEDDLEDLAPDVPNTPVPDTIVSEAPTLESQLSNGETLEVVEDTQGSDEDSDLELVKSLMADLTDDPDNMSEKDTDLDALLDIPELDETAELVIEEQAIELANVQTTDASALDSVDLKTAEEPAVKEGEDILGAILDMTLDDELESQPDDVDLDALMDMDDVAAAEQENILENALDAETALVEPEIEPVADVANDELPSLSDIAAAAEADAVAVETNAMTQQTMGAASAVAAGAGLAALAAKATAPDVTTEDIITENVENAENETIPETAETQVDVAAEPTADPTPEIETQSHQETSMPVKAVVTDTILDEVTETATAGAFAELNQVVEDKAIFNERGPRIGDLVQDALRPMLKEWLDANLKGIVERAVTKEVKRISKGQ